VWAVHRVPIRFLDCTVFAARAACLRQDAIKIREEHRKSVQSGKWSNDEIRTATGIQRPMGILNPIRTRSFRKNGGAVVMDQNNKNRFSSIANLRNILGPGNELQVIYPDILMECVFQWSAVSDEKVIEGIESRLSSALPEDYSSFLQEISNGALLYYDKKYGQWGYRLYSDAELLDKQARWKDLFDEKWRDDFVAIGEIIEEQHPIIAVREAGKTKPTGLPLYEANPLDPIVYWKKMGDSFTDWIDHLITAQGAKFWDWKLLIR
jgi:hypothetical protein